MLQDIVVKNPDLNVDVQWISIWVSALQKLTLVLMPHWPILLESSTSTIDGWSVLDCYCDALV